MLDGLITVRDEELYDDIVSVAKTGPEDASRAPTY